MPTTVLQGLSPEVFHILQGHVQQQLEQQLHRVSAKSWVLIVRVQSRLETAISNLCKIGFHNEQPVELAGIGDSNDAIKIMADVRAYFQGMRPGLSCSEQKGFTG